MSSTATEESPFVPWAESELRRAGLFDQDSDYDGMLGPSIMKLVRAFAGEGHSGGSANITNEVFGRLMRWQVLTPLTDRPDEWMYIEEDVAGNPTTWQNRRQSSCFSQDGGKTYYDIDERLSRPRRAAVWLNWQLPRRLRGTWRFYPRHKSERTN